MKKGRIMGSSGAHSEFWKKKLRPFRGEVCYLSAPEVELRSYFLLIVGLIPIARKRLFSADERRRWWLFLIAVRTLKTPFLFLLKLRFGLVKHELSPADDSEHAWIVRTCPRAWDGRWLISREIISNSRHFCFYFPLCCYQKLSINLSINLSYFIFLLKQK